MKKILTDVSLAEALQDALSEVTGKKAKVVGFSSDLVKNEVRLTIVIGKPSYKKVRADHAIRVQDDNLYITVYVSNKKRAAVESFFGLE